MGVERLELLRAFTQASGASGFEREARELLQRELEPYVNEFTGDNLGSLIGKKRGTSETPRIMVAAHMDEIGFLVTTITEEGFLRFQSLGGWWEGVMLAQRVVVKTRQGDLPGVIGAKPPHVLGPEERKKIVEKKEMFIDIGARSADEAKELGVRPGDPILPASDFLPLGQGRRILAKAWDDRVGCALLVELARELGQRSHPNTVYAAGTVQEEVGLRGAKTAAEVINPDVALVLDVSVANDTPGMSEEPKEKLGKGTSLLIYDGSLLPNLALRDLAWSVAEEQGIPFQYSALGGGGTDAGRIHLHQQGVPSLVLSIPTRYIHSHAGVIDLDDYEATLRLLVELISRLDAATVKGFKQ